jgi:hypothetical protein
MTEDELEESAKGLQGFAKGLSCPNPKCAAGGRIVCQPVEMEGLPLRYV